MRLSSSGKSHIVCRYTRHSVIRAFYVDWNAGYYFRAWPQPARVLASLLREGWGFFFFVSDVLIVPILVCSCLLSLAALRVAVLIHASYS